MTYPLNYRNSQSVQNFLVRRSLSINDENKCDTPAVGQYTKSFVLPYHQRHSRGMNNAHMPHSNKGHTFGTTVFRRDMLQTRYGRSVLRDIDEVPSVGQYTKALVIPYYQRHVIQNAPSTRMHTWGSEKPISSNCITNARRMSNDRLPQHCSIQSPLCSTYFIDEVKCKKV